MGNDLETLVELRERERDDAQAELATKVQMVRQATDEVSAREAGIAELDRMVASVTDRERSRLEASFDVSISRALTEYQRGRKAERDQLTRELDEARERLRDARRAESAARDSFAEAESALVAVQKVHQQQLDEAARLKARRAQDELDEVAINRWREDK